MNIIPHTLNTKNPPAVESMSDNGASPARRYPKRKRDPVSYREFDMDTDSSSDSEEKLLPQKRIRTAQNSRPLPKRKIFPFMRLPAELRNRIYALALSDGDPVYITSKTKAYRRQAIRSPYSIDFSAYRRYRDPDYEFTQEPDKPDEHLEPLVPNLLAVSKTIWNEAASFLYSGPVVFSDTFAVLSFMTQIGSRHAALLRDVSICMWCTSRARGSVNFPAMALCANAVNLERLFILGKLGWFYPWRAKQDDPAKKLARKVFRDCYPWMLAVGNHKGDYAAAIDIVEIAELNFPQQTWDRNLGRIAARKLEVEKEIYRSELKRLLATL